MNYLSIVVDFIHRYYALILFYIPIGIIGIWRWGVWMIRKFVSFFYRQPRGKYKASLSVVTPVYNENPELFRRALESWKQNNPDEIIAVIDYSDESNISVFKNFAEGFSGARLIVTSKPGKRPALADGIKASQGEIVALVDSDTVWSHDIKDKMLGAFSDPQVGGIVTRQDVFKTDTLARKIFKILLDDRYLLEYPFLGAVSDALLCLSGRTALYRRSAIIEELGILVHDTFWGEPMISGDDKTLTRIIHSKGWKSRYLKDVVVYTSGTPMIKDFLKQKVRWTRNGLRSDSKALFSAWLWKRHKILALHMLDKFVSPITLLLGPIYFILAIYFGHYAIAGILLAWWTISRAIKIFPHIREKPQDIFVLPEYIFMTFVIALVKIYALMTVDVQGWLTRWDSSRFTRLGFFRKTFSYSATAAVFIGMFYLVFNYKSQVLAVDQAEKQKAAEIKQAEKIERLYSFMTPDKSRTSDEELEKTKMDLAKKQKSDPYGYYVAKPGDTVPLIRKRYNLASNGKVLDARTKGLLDNSVALGVGQRIAIPVEDLRSPIDANLALPNLLIKPPRITYETFSNTIFVRQGGSIATLSKINQALPPTQKRLLEQTSPGEWILRANLYIGKDVTLILDGSEVKYLKLKSGSDGFVWLRSQNGNLLIKNTKITSWDEKVGNPDLEHESGRSYITAKSSGRMDIINSELAYLGYAGLPKRGGPFGGSYGVSWKNESRSFRNDLLTGVVTGSKFHNNYFGFYTFGVTGMLVDGNDAYDNVQYGFDPHDDSNNMLIENNRAYRNGNHGIIISRRCFQNSIINNESFNNRLHGIMVDRDSPNNLVEGNKIYGNVDGIAIYGSNENLVLGNNVKHNVRGIRLNAKATGNYVENNDFSSNSRGVYIYDQAFRNILINNQVKDNDIGITVKNASDNMLFDNFTRFDNRKDGRITEDAYDNNIQ